MQEHDTLFNLIFDELYGAFPRENIDKLQELAEKLVEIVETVAE